MYERFGAAGFGATILLVFCASAAIGQQVGDRTVDVANLEVPKTAPKLTAATAESTAIAGAISVEARSVGGIDGQSVVAFYAERGNQPYWLSAASNEHRAESLMARLDDAGSHALPPSRYAATALRNSVRAASAAGATAQSVAKAELALTRAYIRYGVDISSGLLEPRDVDRELHVYPDRPDARLLLRKLTTAPDTRAALDSLPPPAPEYSALRDQYRVMTRLSREGDWGAVIANGKSLRPGQVSYRVEQLRARLAALGDYTGAVSPEGKDARRFDPELVEAVKVFQARHGLSEDGVVGSLTRKAINESAKFRASQIAVNLERMRWLNRDLGHRYIIVNQAAFTMRLVEGSRTLLQSRVVVGKSRKHQTPEFSDEMTHMVVNPTWHVPRSIATKEILPKLKRDPYYAQNRGMSVIPRGGGSVDPGLTDWSAYSEGYFPYSVKQRPGRRNALGRVKFMFPNDFAIYLHDTPAKRLFKKDERAYSHGCVRVEKPLELAEVLLGLQESDPKGRLDSLLSRGRERALNLDQPVPVHLTYRTAWIDETGSPQFRHDVYGRDKRIFSALEAAGVTSPNS